MMKNNKLFLILFLSMFLLTTCEMKKIKVKPVGEIVFMPDGFLTDEKIAFADKEFFHVNQYPINVSFVKPVWSFNGKYLYGLTTYSGGAYIGYPAYWDIESGSYKQCDKNLPYYLQIQGTENPENSKEVILNNVEEIVIMDLETCQIKQVLVNENNYKNDYMILGMSYHSQKRIVTYGLYCDYPEGWRYEIILHHVDTGDEEVIGLGVNPSWSNDGKRIAYFGADGRLYIMNSYGSNINNPIPSLFFESQGNINAPLKPFIHWSPDDKWLIYHRCDDFKLSVKYCQIYKLNVESLEEEMIIDQGMYPDWNPSSGE